MVTSCKRSGAPFGKIGADETTALQGGRAKNALMKPLRSRAVKQTTLSSPLRIRAVADGGTVLCRKPDKAPESRLAE
jgi:hypothetical protein